MTLDKAKITYNWKQREYCKHREYTLFCTLELCLICNRLYYLHKEAVHNIYCLCLVRVMLLLVHKPKRCSVQYLTEINSDGRSLSSATNNQAIIKDKMLKAVIAWHIGGVIIFIKGIADSIYIMPLTN